MNQKGRRFLKSSLFLRLGLNERGSQMTLFQQLDSWHGRCVFNGQGENELISVTETLRLAGSAQNQIPVADYKGRML